MIEWAQENWREPADLITKAGEIVAQLQRDRLASRLSPLVDQRVLVCLACAPGHALYLRELKLAMWQHRVFPQFDGYATWTNTAIARLTKNGLVIDHEDARRTGSHALSSRKIRLTTLGLNRLGLIPVPDVLREAHADGGHE